MLSLQSERFDVDGRRGLLCLAVRTTDAAVFKLALVLPMVCADSQGCDDSSTEINVRQGNVPRANLSPVELRLGHSRNIREVLTGVVKRIEIDAKGH